MNTLTDNISVREIFRLLRETTHETGAMVSINLNLNVSVTASAAEAATIAGDTAPPPAAQKPAEKAAEKPTEKPVEKPATPVAPKAIEAPQPQSQPVVTAAVETEVLEPKPAQKPAEKPAVKKPIQKPMTPPPAPQKAAEKPAEKPTEKPAEKPTAPPPQAIEPNNIAPFLPTDDEIDAAACPLGMPIKYTMEEVRQIGASLAQGVKKEGLPINTIIKTALSMLAGVDKMTDVPPEKYPTIVALFHKIRRLCLPDDYDTPAAAATLL